MNNPQRKLSEQLAELRNSFNRQFEQPIAPPTAPADEYLIAGARTARFGLRLNSLLSLENRRNVVPVPVEAAVLMGLAGFRGHIIPVFDLAVLLGGEGGPAALPWLVVCQSEELIGLAFERFEGTARVAQQDLVRTVSGDEVHWRSAQAFRTENGIVHIVDLPAVMVLAKRCFMSA